MAERWDREDRIDREILVKLATLGVCGLTVPEEFGGMGRRVTDTVVTIVELAKRSTALAGHYIMNACYGSLNIAMEGTPEQKQRFLPWQPARSCLPTACPSPMSVPTLPASPPAPSVAAIRLSSTARSAGARALTSPTTF